jgi:hypothetical protein
MRNSLYWGLLPVSLKEVLADEQIFGIFLHEVRLVWSLDDILKVRGC